MKKNQSEQVEQGLLPTMPIVCTDGNLRSMKEYHENGWVTTHSDSNIDKMIETLSAVMKIDKKKLSIKATTTEGLGFVGREEGVAAHCVTLINKI